MIPQIKITTEQYNYALKVIRAYNYQKVEPNTNKLIHEIPNRKIRLTDGEILTKKEIDFVKLYLKGENVNLTTLSRLDLAKMDINKFYRMKGVTKIIVNRLLNFFDFIDVNGNGRRINRNKILDNLSKTLTKEQKIIILNKLTIQRQIDERREQKAKEREELKLAKEQKAKDRLEEKKQKKLQDEIFKKAYLEAKELRIKEREERKKERLADPNKRLREQREKVNLEKLVKLADPIYKQKDEQGNNLFFLIENELKVKTCEILRNYFILYKGLQADFDTIARDELLDINIPKFVKLADFKKATVNDMVLFLNKHNIPTAYKVNEKGTLVMK